MRLRLWSKRHPLLAASGSALLVMALLLAAFLVRAVRAERAEAHHRRVAEERLVEVQRMSDLKKIEQLLATEKELWPRRPRGEEAMRRWLRDARALHARMGGHRRTVEQLERRLIPEDAELRARSAARRRASCPELLEAITLAGLVVEKKRAEWADARRAAGAPPKELPSDRDLSQAEDDSLGPIREALTVKRLLENDPRLQERLHEVRERDGEEVSRLDTWRLAVLKDLLAQEEVLEARIRDVEDRLAFARSVASLREEHAAAWQRVIAEIGGRKGAYATWSGPAPRPQPGLVPLGRDRRSGLWEFAHLDSGPPATWQGEAGWWKRRRGDPSGHVDLPASFNASPDGPGVVLVLLPGGAFTMGATRDEEGPHYDRLATRAEQPVHEVPLAPFYVSKYELTQGQVARAPEVFSREELEREQWELRRRFLGTPWDRRRPAAHLDFAFVQEMARRWDLQVPTEAQWEYAARAGSHTPWWCGKTAEELPSVARGTATVPVGSGPPNPFGVHDVIGNVQEWTRDALGGYDLPTHPVSGLRAKLRRFLGSGSMGRVVRGGSFHGPPRTSRSAARSDTPMELRRNDLGARLVLTPDPR